MSEPTPTTKTGGCSVRTSTDIWRQQECGKPVKGTLLDGAPACGLHLRAERNREEAAAVLNAKLRESDRKAASAQALVKRFRALGIRAGVDYSFNARAYTGGITLGPDDAAEVLALLEKKEGA